MKKLQGIVLLICMITGTGLSAQTLIYSEDFEGTSGSAIPATWSQSMAPGSDGWKSGSGSSLESTYYHPGDHSPRFLATNDDACDCNKSRDLIMSPALDFSSLHAPVLEFDALFGAETDVSGRQEIGTVEVSTDSGATWTVVKTLDRIFPWATQYVSLFDYRETPNVMIGIRYNDDGSWGYGMAIDNFKVIEVPKIDAAVTAIFAEKYILEGPVTVKAVLENQGGEEITSAKLNYSVDGVVTAIPQTFSTSIAYKNNYQASFTAPTVALNAGLHLIKAWVEQVNDSADANPANDTAMFYVSSMASKPAKNVLVEENTGAWCGFCPRGGLRLSAMTAGDTAIIGIAEHNEDNMSTPEGDLINSNYNYLGFPSGMVDRALIGDYYVGGDPDWAAAIAARKLEVVPATVALSALSYDSETRQISATVVTNFVGSVRGNFSLNCIVTENNIVGPWTDTTDNQWNQHSYFYNDSTSSLYQRGLVSAPYWSPDIAGLMPGDWVHNHVVDAILGGPFGDPSVIPTSVIDAGQSFSKTFTYTLPSENPGGATRFNPDNIHIVGIVAEYDSIDNENRHILNVTQRKLNSNSETTSIRQQETKPFGTIFVFPNPVVGKATVSIELNTAENIRIAVYNILGEMVTPSVEKSLSAGRNSIDLNVADLANGIYNVLISSGNRAITKTISVSK